MAADDYEAAVEALLWDSEPRWSGDQLRQAVTDFFGGNEPWSVVVPNDRLVGVIDDGVEWVPPGQDGQGWMLASIPVTTRPEDPKADDIPLMGLAASFFVRRVGDVSHLEFEIFHA